MDPKKPRLSQEPNEIDELRGELTWLRNRLKVSEQEKDQLKQKMSDLERHGTKPDLLQQRLKTQISFKEEDVNRAEMARAHAVAELENERLKYQETERQYVEKIEQLEEMLAMQAEHTEQLKAKTSSNATDEMDASPRAVNGNIGTKNKEGIAFYPKLEGEMLTGRLLAEGGHGWIELLKAEGSNSRTGLDVLIDISCGLIPPSDLLHVLMPPLVSCNENSRVHALSIMTIAIRTSTSVRSAIFQSPALVTSIIEQIPSNFLHEEETRVAVAIECLAALATYASSEHLSLFKGVIEPARLLRGLEVFKSKTVLIHILEILLPLFHNDEMLQLVCTVHDAAEGPTLLESLSIKLMEQPDIDVRLRSIRLLCAIASHHPLGLQILSESPHMVLRLVLAFITEYERSKHQYSSKQATFICETLQLLAYIVTKVHIGGYLEDNGAMRLAVLDDLMHLCHQSCLREAAPHAQLIYQRILEDVN